MDDLISFLLQFGQLNQQQMQLIKESVFERTLKRDGFFSEAGKIPREIGYIRSGIMRVHYFNDKGEEITRYFIEENNIVVDVHCFDHKTPSTQYVQAVTDCELLIFSEEALKTLSATILDWDLILGKIREKGLLDKVRRIAPMMSEDATSRYLSFLEKFPGLVNRIPLSYLATYLGITQSSLSRIRKQLANGHSSAG
jgi:CRP-like cAMP-binding protein